MTIPEINKWIAGNISLPHSITSRFNIPENPEVNRSIRIKMSSELKIIADNISIDALQNNLTQTGSLFTRREQMTLLSKSVAIKRKGLTTEAEVPKTENMQEMLMAFAEYIPHIVSESFFKQYRDKFDKYYPKFYTNVTCPSCGNSMKFQLDLEIEFFRRSLFGGREGSEEL